MKNSNDSEIKLMRVLVAILSVMLVVLIAAGVAILVIEGSWDETSILGKGRSVVETSKEESSEDEVAPSLKEEAKPENNGSAEVEDTSEEGNGLIDITEEEAVAEAEAFITEEQNAFKAYAKVLAANPGVEISDDDYYDAAYYPDNYEKHISSAAFTDINGDSVPEMLCVKNINFRCYVVDVYAYYDGNAQLAATLDCFANANGAYVTGICTGGHIHNTWSGADPMGNQISDETVYVFDGVNCIGTDDECYNFFTDLCGLLKSNDSKLISDLENGKITL